MAPDTKRVMLTPAVCQGWLGFHHGVHITREREDIEKRAERKREERNGRDERGEDNENNSNFAAAITRRGCPLLSLIVTISLRTIDTCDQTLHTKGQI